jgi:hypothetical protein
MGVPGDWYCARDESLDVSCALFGPVRGASVPTSSKVDIRVGMLHVYIEAFLCRRDRSLYDYLIDARERKSQLTR